MKENMKKFNPKKVAIAFIIIIAFAILVAPVSAAVKGNLTFTHGANNSSKNTYAKINSTATENSMQFIGLISYETGYNAGNVLAYESTKKTNTKSHQQTLYPGSVRGKSYFYYFVDNICQHQSTAWWNFNFR